jgi:hypothetical protein
MNDKDNEILPALPNGWNKIQPDTIYQTSEGRKISFGKDQIELGTLYDPNGKHLKAIEKGRVSPKGNNGLVPSQEAGFELKSKVLGKGGNYRFHGKILNGILYFSGKITTH